ncbi:hypothetical protein ACHAW6_010281 [Cyclotella cf. meneghiniana]
MINTPNTRWMMADIKNFYLNMPLKQYENLKLRMSNLPDNVIERYNLRELVTPEGFVYVVRKGMYGLHRAGLLAHRLSKKRLNAKEYHQSKYMPGLWMHKSRSMQFTLVVDDFRINM